MTGQRLIERILFPGKRINRENLLRAVSGKTILITGATYGIGDALVRQLAGMPVRLVLIARTKEKLYALQQELATDKTDIVTFPVDLYRREEVELLIRQLKAFPFEIDILIHNAGKSICRPVEQSTERFHDFTRTMAVNYESPVQISLALLPGLIQRKGHIIYVSAVNALFHSVPGWSAYQASKTAMDQWGKAARTELAYTGVSISAIYLPLVRTRMIEPTRAYQDTPAMQPEQAARIVCHSIIRRFRYWSPWWSLFPSTLSRLFPVLWSRTVWSSFKKEKP